MEQIYAEAPVVSQGLGVGWVERRSPGWGGANVVTAPIAIACKTDDNDMVLSFTYSAETPVVTGTGLPDLSERSSGLKVNEAG